jgi:hypothetical protein
MNYKRFRIMAPLDSEGSAGGSDSLVDAFAAHFEGVPVEDDKAAPAVAETDDDAAARALADEQAEEAPADAEVTQDDAQAEPDKVTLEVDGKPVEMTKAELAEHVKNGMRQQDYTKKTMEVAEQRKAAEAEAAKAREQREEFAGKLERFSVVANAELTQLQAQLTPELLHSDPVEYLDKRRILETRQAELSQAQRELEQINGQRQQEREQSVQQFIQHQEEILSDKLPDWKDSTKKAALKAKLEPFLREQGFSEKDGLAVLDARLLLMATDAMKYRELVSRAKATPSAVAKVPPKVARTGTPSVAPTDGRTRAMRELTETGSRDAAAKVFAEMFG